MTGGTPVLLKAWTTRTLLLLTLLCHAAGLLAQEKKDAGPIKAAVIKPTKETLTVTVEMTGQVKAWEETPIWAKVPGFVSAVHVDIGDRVEKGKVLIELSAPELMDEVREREALAELAKAELTQTQANVEVAQAKIATAQAQVAEADAHKAEADAQLDLTKREYARFTQLANSGSVTRQLVDETQRTMEVAAARRQQIETKVTSAQAALLEAQALLKKAQSDVQAGQARVAVALANVGKAKTNVDYLTLKAPFAGVITQRAVDVGHLTGGSKTPLLTLSNLDTLRLALDVPESEAGAIKVKDQFDIDFAALKGGKTTGSIARMSYLANKTMLAEIDLANPDRRYLPGMYIRARRVTKSSPDSVVLPTSAINDLGGQPFVFVVTDGKLVKTPIKVGMIVDKKAEIATGLDEKSSVVSIPLPASADGQAVVTESK